MKNTLALVLSVISIFGVGYLIYFQNFYIPQKIKKCHEIAVNYEKLRQYPVDNLNVTNQDISGYMKNMVSCMGD